MILPDNYPDEAVKTRGYYISQILNVLTTAVHLPSSLTSFLTNKLDGSCDTSISLQNEENIYILLLQCSKNLNYLKGFIRGNIHIFILFLFFRLIKLSYVGLGWVWFDSISFTFLPFFSSLLLFLLFILLYFTSLYFFFVQYTLLYFTSLYFTLLFFYLIYFILLYFNSLYFFYIQYTVLLLYTLFFFFFFLDQLYIP